MKEGKDMREEKNIKLHTHEILQLKTHILKTIHKYRNNNKQDTANRETQTQNIVSGLNNITVSGQ